MSLLDKLKTVEPIAYPLLDRAMEVVNSDLSFQEKLNQVQALEDEANGQEAELFGDVYSSLSSHATNDQDLKLLSGGENGR